MKGNGHMFKTLRGGGLILVLAYWPQAAMAGYVAEVLADHPIAYWRLEETGGTTAVDSAGDNDGTIFGGISSVPGVVGNAFQFDGLSGRVNMGNPATLDFGTAGEFSLEAWFNWDGRGSSVNNIIRKADFPVSPPGAGYWLRIDRDSQLLEFHTGETTGTSGFSNVNINTLVTPGTRHHVVATRDAGTMRLYLDGILRATASALNANTTSGAPFLLGAWDDRFGVIELFSGLIDEAAVYNVALSAERILAHFNAAVSTAICTPSATALCLNNSRFKVEATFQAPAGEPGGQAQVVKLTQDTGYFWFFDASNVEVVIKVLNACSFNQRYWVFAGGLTNVQTVITVTDTRNGTVKVYSNPQSTKFQPIQDTSAFATCP